MLNSVSNRSPIRIKMSDSDDHSVCHRALSGLEALRPGRGKLLDSQRQTGGDP